MEQKNMLATKRLSYSALKAFGKSPRHYVQHRLFPRVPTEAMMVGSAFDCLALTPDEFDGKYQVLPKFPPKDKKITTTIAERKEKYLSEHKGVTFLNQANMDTVNKMVVKILDNENASVYLRAAGKVQEHIFWSDKETGLKFHGYIDKLCPDFMFDLKKVADGSKDAFQRDAIKYGYPLQAACYQLGTGRLFGGNEKPFLYVTMEASEPFNANVFKASEDYLSFGYQQYKMLCKEFVRCVENDCWNEGYEFFQGMGYESLMVPPWAKI